MASNWDKNWDRVAVKYGTDKASSFEGHQGHNYMPHYQAALEPVAGQITKLLELGVYRGASLFMWRHLLPGAHIYGVDNNPQIASTARITVVTGDVTDKAAMNTIGQSLGPFDVIVDDASHNPNDVLTAYTQLAPHCRRYYFIEDLPATQTAELLELLPGVRSTVYPSDWPDQHARTLIEIA